MTHAEAHRPRSAIVCATSAPRSKIQQKWNDTHHSVESISYLNWGVEGKGLGLVLQGDSMLTDKQLAIDIRVNLRMRQ